MSLRIKTLLVMALTLAGLLAGLFLISRTIVLGGFAHLEEEDVRENVTRFQEALSEEVTQIDRTAGDWAPWDDTYAFIEDGNQEYIDSNLTDDTLVNLDLNLMLFVHSSGRLVFGRTVDLEQGASVPISASVEQELVGDDFLLSHKDTDSSISGIVLLPEGPLLVASQPILTSDNRGPIRGTLIMGRYLDAAKLQELAVRTRLSVQVHRRDDADIPPDFEPAFSSLEGDSVFVQPLDRDSIAGYTLLHDVYGQPALTLRIDTPREIYQQGMHYTLYLIVALTGLGLTFGLVAVFLLERFVLRRLASLRAAVKKIGASGDLRARVPVVGNDELSDLGAAINTTLNALERSQAERQRAQEELRLLNEQLVKEQREVEALNRSLEAKVRERTKELRLANEELSGRNSELQDARAQAATDALTGLRNHRAFQEKVREEIAHAEDNGSPLGLIMMDIDGFKHVNDSRGHLVGDSILRDLASSLTDQVGRESAYRYGGDEFALLLPGVDRRKTATVAEQLRRAVENQADGNGSSQKITVSLGIACFPHTAASAEELIYGADAAMYWAKSAGKNRVGDWSRLLPNGTEGALPWYAADRTVKAPDVVAALVAALAAKDPLTAGHTERCSWYALKLAEELGLPEGQTSVVRLASLLHDVGKIAIPDEVLFKPDQLNEEEWAQMKQHPTAALHVLSHIRSLTDATPAILHHHEHFDGSGYPDGLAGEEIPIASRILLVTDAFDAMTTDRPYRKAMPVEAAIAELRRCCGSQFDPVVVDAFLRVLARHGAQPLRQQAAAEERERRSDVPAARSR